MSMLASIIRSGILASGRRLLGLGSGRKAEDFRNLFGQFRQVLELHNTAAEHIADMGEKLSGEYIFDIVYIRQAYNELHRTFADFIQGFSVLTKDRYPGLRNRMDSIDHEIRQLIDHEEVPGTDLVLPLSGAGTNRLRDVGGKMANLADAGKLAEVTIPQGFVITTRAFDEFLRHNGLSEKVSALIERWEEDASVLDDVRSAVLAGTIPPGISTALGNALDELTGSKPAGFLAVRSSAVGEDGEYSFAGQFETVLNVPADMSALSSAYKQVIASLFSRGPFLYCRKIGCDAAAIKMAVGCILMIDASASGVTYSSDPSGNSGEILINATWGLGKSLVEGQVDADTYRIGRSPQPAVREKKIGTKTTMIVAGRLGGTAVMKTPAAMVQSAVLDDTELLTMANQALRIERIFRRPQDIEWAIDRNRRITVLQTRPLMQIASANDGRMQASPDNLPILQSFSGIPVRKGTGAGEVFIPSAVDDLDGFPKGGVLVARHDSSHFIRIMPYASAILTDMGTPTSHMSSLCREFRVPTAVNCGAATASLSNGQQVTVSIGEDSAVVYKGIHRNIPDSSNEAIEELYEFRKKKYLLRYILPLNLVDPYRDDFSAEGCRTLHDILRFIHEKMVLELVEAAEGGLTDRTAVRLDLPVPAGIVAVDLGGGIESGERTRAVTIDQVTSVPLRAVLDGLTYPGAWHTEVVALQAGDLLAGMMKLADLTAPAASNPTSNLAVVSHEYMNLSLKFGYHFTMLDCYCSPNRTNNHIFFRFSGGATDLVKRSRRIRLIENILRTSGFICESRGALITARISNIGQDEMIGMLDMIGRLLAYTRQLDAVLHSDESVDLHISNFLRGDYRL